MLFRSLSQIEKFLMDSPGWYESSVNIAKKIMEDITKISSKFSRIQTPSWQDIIYVRGAAKEKGRSANIMEKIGYLFDVANKNEKYFGDINKWSPADIYFASSAAEKKIDEAVSLISGRDQSKVYDFLDLNKLTSDLVDSGDLLPLSLKKAVDYVKLVEVNFNRSVEEEYLSDIDYFGVSDWSKKYTVEKPITRDIKIYFSKDKKEKIFKKN